jgi:hypothetical protein
MVCPILAICSDQALLRIRVRSRIARARPDFDRFSEMCASAPGSFTTATEKYSARQSDSTSLALVSRKLDLIGRSDPMPTITLPRLEGNVYPAAVFK